ncbi:hypothetical protein TYRP_012120 [Tyrophagus putrescentiae]|nr:hypothetical protein TYRP_012120 [Tyrophagus putrescentiae]
MRVLILATLSLVLLLSCWSGIVQAYISCSNPARAMGNWLGSRSAICPAGPTTGARGAHVGSNCNNIPPLTAIATFLGPYGTYDTPNLSQHSAIFIRCEPQGIRVFDQWRGQPISMRLIPWRGWNQNAGKNYYTIAT